MGQTCIEFDIYPDNTGLSGFFTIYKLDKKYVNWNILG